MTAPAKTNGHYLAITAIGSGSDKQAQQLISNIIKRGCDLQEVRINPLGNNICANFLVSGNWSALARLEAALPALGEQLALAITFQRSEITIKHNQSRPYGVEVIAPQKTDLLDRVLAFFASQGVHINEIVMQNYQSSHTDANMSNLQLMAFVPNNQHPQALRESFMDLCDDLNADGLLDPIKT